MALTTEQGRLNGAKRISEVTRQQIIAELAPQLCGACGSFPNGIVTTVARKYQVSRQAVQQIWANHVASLNVLARENLVP